MCVCQMSQAFDYFGSFVLHCLMAAKDTSKKLYFKSASTEVYSLSCRLCKAVVDRDHCRDLFGPKNRLILKNAEAFYKFKNVIAETQKSLQQETRSKRCLDRSPSVAQPSSRVRMPGSSSGSG